MLQEQILQEKLDAEHRSRLAAIKNPAVHRFVAEFVALCNPQSVYVATDAPEDAEYIRQEAVRRGEETPLATPGHTVHYDSYWDQARDREHTRYLVMPGMDLGAQLNTIERAEGLAEVRSYLKDSMRGREALLCFFCLGPRNSPFSIPAVQLTDSAYVAHSACILYRSGYEFFRGLDPKEEGFFRIVHSQGRLENGVSVELDKRRIYIDLQQETVYSVNTQYAGNTVGLKKLSLRLAICKAAREGWLAEHMLIVGVRGPGGRTTYFTGAFPSACGKTSTAMIPGESILGDDLAYLRAIGGKARAANVEQGIFGIIRDVNPHDDPLIWEVLNKPGEVIFSNVLVADGKPYWLGMGVPVPPRGRNHSGEWYEGKRDEKGQLIPLAHPNARYTVRMEPLRNCDPNLHEPLGVEVSGFIYGGRDSDTSVPVEQAFDWAHGIITKGACLESESTSATLGKVGVRSLNPMSNIDFLAIPLGRYILNNLRFAESLDQPPAVFGVNYFLKGRDGRYLTAMEDKRIWLKWMELRVHGEVDAIERPTGLIPRYEDLRALFREHLGKDYSRAQYEEQFAPRIENNLRKIDRVEKIYRQSVPDAPHVFFEVLRAQRERLQAAL